MLHLGNASIFGYLTLNWSEFHFIKFNFVVFIVKLLDSVLLLGLQEVLRSYVILNETVYVLTMIVPMSVCLYLVLQWLEQAIALDLVAFDSKGVILSGVPRFLYNLTELVFLLRAYNVLYIQGVPLLVRHPGHLLVKRRMVNLVDVP